MTIVFPVATRAVTGREISENAGLVLLVGDDALLQAENGISYGVRCVSAAAARWICWHVFRASRTKHSLQAIAATKPGFGNAMREPVEFDVTVPTTQDFFRSDDA